MSWMDWVVCAALCASMASSSCSDEGGEWCPEGWVEPGDGTCRAPEGFEAGLAGEIGSGVYGWARVTEGNCMPSAGCFNRGDCATSLEPGVEIVAYRRADVQSSTGAGDCYRRYELADGAATAGTAVVDGDGVYRMQLPAGDYALTATDPVDGCPFLAGTARVNADAPITYVHFDFDHGAY